MQVAFVHFDESYYLDVGVAAPEILVEELVKHIGGGVEEAFAALGVKVIQNQLSFPQGIEFIVSESNPVGADSYVFHVKTSFL